MSRLGPAMTVVVLAASGLLMVSPIDDPDLWWLLRSGAYMVETRSFPTTDPFSATAFGAEWINHAWGFELLLYGVYRLLGMNGLIVLAALFAVATFAVLYRLLRREGVGQGWALAAIAVGAMGTRGFWTPRPQLVTYLFLAAFWAVLRDYRDGRADRLAWLPPLTFLWVNLHGGFMIGPALIGLCFVGELLGRVWRVHDQAPRLAQIGRLALFGLASGAAAFANPFHYRAVAFPFQVLADRLPQAFITEWASPPFQHAQVMLLEGLVLGTLVLLLRVRQLRAPSDVIVLAAFFHFALHAVRNIPLLVIVLLPILVRALAEWSAETLPALVALRGWVRQRVAVGLVAAAVPLVVWWGPPLRQLDEYRPRLGVAPIFPEGAVEFLKRERPAGVLFNDYGWGGYLIWRLYPDYRVTIDGRVAVYGPRRFAAHVEVADVRPRWRDTLNRLGAGLALIRAYSPLATVLKASPDWQVLYEDRLAVVFGKRGARP